MFTRAWRESRFTQTCRGVEGSVRLSSAPTGLRTRRAPFVRTWQQAGPPPDGQIWLGLLLPMDHGRVRGAHVCLRRVLARLRIPSLAPATFMALTISISTASRSRHSAQEERCSSSRRVRYEDSRPNAYSSSASSEACFIARTSSRIPPVPIIPRPRLQTHGWRGGAPSSGQPSLRSSQTERHCASHWNRQR